MKKEKISKVKNPKISFVTPCYNDGDYIERMVESIMTQDYKNIEQIVVNDGSTDNSKKVLDKLARKFKNLKVIHLKKNQGACNARNIGAKEATGKYISFLPADAMLYPGMVRVWINNLEERPDCDFLYGGYRITDEQYRGLMDYMGDEFDPYFLQVNNYIDGSYPLKMELYKKLIESNTKYYKSPMGAWDTNIKSLQDWDFWLNAVLWNKAIGHYMPDVFFETVRPHKGGLSDDSHNNWIERTTAIKNKYGIVPKKICVTSQGARFHAKNMAKILNADFLDMPSFKPHNYEMIYMVGFFGNVMETFKFHDGLRVLHWIGSDIYSLVEAYKKEQIQIGNGQVVNGKDWVDKQVAWIKDNIDVNLCEFEPTRKELESIGIKAQVIPIPPKEFYNITPLPKKFTIGVYDPANNKEFYYPDLIKSIASKMPDVEWKFYGDYSATGKKKNIQHCGRIKDMGKFINDCSALLRVTPHDGLPLSIIEFASAGRNIITNVPGLRYVNKVSLKEKDIIKTVKKVKKMGLNKSGSHYYRNLADHNKFKESIYSLMDYDAYEYWENRADIWNQLEGSTRDAQEEYIIKNEIEKINPSNVLDIGCGNGLWADILADGRGYLGIDISPTLIKHARKKRPQQSFMVADIRKLSKQINREFDLGFCYTSLLHLKPEELKPALEELFKVCKKVLLIEPTVKMDKRGIITRSLHPLVKEAQEKGSLVYGIRSSFVHNYFNELNIERQFNLGPRTLMVCKSLKTNEKE